MVLTAVRGGIGFLSRLPIGRDRIAWEAFRETPAAFVVTGYLLGGVLALPFFLPASVPEPVVAFAYLAWVLVVTGINHADGLADLGDAAVAHGSPPARRRIMRDTTVGVGGTLAVALVVAGLVLGAWGVTTLPLVAGIGLVVASEVAAKVAMATLVCLGEPSHEGMAARVVGPARPASLVGVVALAIPAAALTWPTPAAGAALIAGVLASLVLLAWARRTLGGVGGDVVGAGNEVARVLALHAGVVAWTLW